ncbi:MAG: hypothetical protein ACFFDW_14120 [Candidatus Thorarchaeota archaeon]
MSEGHTSLNPKIIEKLTKKAKELGYEKIEFFIDDLDMLLRPSNLLKDKDMKYFELENLISLLNSKNISLGMAPRMISMVSKYSERNDELEDENSSLKQENISLKSKFETADIQLKELQNQLKNLSAAPQQDVKIREENIKLTEENKYLKMTNESLDSDLKNTKGKLDTKIEEANDLEVENSQLEMRIKDLQRNIKDLEDEIEEAKQTGAKTDDTLKKIEEIIEELDEVYGTVDDPFKKEFLAFLGVELTEIVDDRHITKQKILNQIAIHAHEIEKVFEPQIQALARQPTVISTQTAIPERTPIIQQTKTAKVEEEVIPEPVKRSPVKMEEEVKEEPESKIEEDIGDRYVKPSEFLKGKRVITKEDEEEKSEEKVEEEEEEEKQKQVSYPKKKTGKVSTATSDRTPSPELTKVFDVFIKYLEAINDNNSFNDLCDKMIDELYGHIGSPGMTQVYKVKSGGVKRKQMLIDILKQWKIKLPDM